jgi:hypothetical protein
MTKKIGFIGRGTYYKQIHKHLKEHGVDSTLLNDYPHHSYTRDVVVNYGLSGTKLDNWRLETIPRLRRGMINSSIFGNKLMCCEAVRAVGVPVPETPRIDGNWIPDTMAAAWIVKPLASFGGRGIVPYSGQAITPRQYLQKRVTNRRYELRVHAVKWLPVEEWLVSKRTHPDGEAQLTWNHHQGGSFANISMQEGNTGVFKRAKEYAKKVIETLGYDFSAVDFIVQNSPTGVQELPVWFIEANLAPGFTSDRTREFYCDAFMKLAQQDTPAISIPPPVPVQETPVQLGSFRLNMSNQLDIIRFVSSTGGSLTSGQLIEFINSLR